jgi:PAS domain S-box-containing protein
MSESTIESLVEATTDVVKDAPIRVLHVDDETGFLKVAKQCLEMQGKFEVETAASVEEAFEILKEKEYDVIISDYQMPEKDGLKFLQELREAENSTPFVMFTGRGREEVAIKALNLGADRYFCKTGSPETVYGELAHGITKAVENKRIKDALLESEESLRYLLDSIDDLIFVIDLNGFFRNYYQPSRKENFYVPPVEFLGKHFRDVLPPDVAELLQAALEKIKNGSKAQEFDYPLEINGAKQWFNAKLWPMKDKLGGATSVSAVIRNVTLRKEAEQALRASEEKYRSLFENSRNVAIVFDLKGRITSVSNAAMAKYGFKKGEMIGKNMLKFVSKKYWPRLLKDVAQLARGKVTKGTVEINTPKGKKTAEYESCPITLGNKIVGIQSIMVDITERKHTNKMLKESKKKYEVLINDSPVAICNIDMKGEITYVNKKFEELSGYSKDEIIGKDGFKLGMVSENTLKSARGWIKTELMNDLVSSKGFKIKTKDSQWVWVDGTSRLIKNNNVPVGIQILLTDITERKKAEAALRESEERYRSIVENAPDLIVTVDKKGVVTSCNSAVGKGTGYSKDEVIGRHFLNIPITRGIDAGYAQSLFRSIMEEKLSEPLEIEWFLEDGTPRLSEIRINLMKREGKAIGFTAIARDITERKKIEETLRKSEEQISGFMDSATDGFMLFDSQLDLVEVNKSALKILGLSREDVIRKNILDISPDTKEKGRYEKYREVIRTAEPFAVEDLIIHPKFGEKHIALKAFKVGDGLGIIGTDITERKKAEAKVESERRKLESIIDSMADPVCITSLEDEIIMVNNAAVNLFQVSREELLTLRGFDLAAEEDLPKVSKAMQDLLKTGLPQNVEVTGRLYGAKDRPFWMKFALLKDKNGEPAGIVTVARDITERKKAEEKLKVLNEKLGVVGGLTRHDVRNKLSAITGNVYLAKQKTSEGEVLAHLRDVDSSVSQIVKILDFASAYEKLGAEKLFAIDVGKAVDEAVSLFSDLSDVKVVNDCHGLTVLADSLLRQLFYNLIHNSLMHGEKVSSIRAYSYETDEDAVKLIYKDDGVGVPKTEKEKIFEKGYGKGTGYGLFLIQKMCEIYGWTIRETGKLGKGAQFTITIPRLNP